jgi:protein SCO1/2
MEKGNLKYFIVVASALLIAVTAFSIDQYYAYNTLPILSGEIGEENGEIIYQDFENFTGFDQDGNDFDISHLKGKVHVANFFFCSCPVVCPKMTMETKKVANAMGERDDFLIVSYSIDPERDSVQELNDFASKFEANQSNWYFVNVGKQNVYKLARNSYKIVAVQGNKVSQDFIHSELLTLVDQEMRVRGYYDSTDPKELEKLIKDLKKIL